MDVGEAKLRWVQSSPRYRPLYPDDGDGRINTFLLAQDTHCLTASAMPRKPHGLALHLSPFHCGTPLQESLSVEHPPCSAFPVTPQSPPTQLLAAALCAAVNVSVTVVHNMRPPYR